MSKRLTLEQYIQQAEAIHGKGVYDYSKTKYINRNTEVWINCKFHGEFHLASAKDHLQFKRGCPLCNRFNKYNEFYKIKYKAYPYVFSSELFSLSVYKNKEDVIVTCKKHNICFIKSTDYLRDCKNLEICEFCRKETLLRERQIKKENKIRLKKTTNRVINNEHLKLSHEEVTKRVKDIYGEHNDCKDLIYINSNTPFNFTCTKHNYICKSSIKMIRKEPDIIKCIHCRKERDVFRKEEKSFREGIIFKVVSNFKYDFKFDYSKTDYKTFTSKSIIIGCPEHGDIETTPTAHLNNKYGCFKCAVEKEHGGFNKDKYIEVCGERSPNLYLVECFNDNEKFYKIGMTVNTISKRFKGSKFPYNVKLVNKYSNSSDIIFDAEKELHLKLKEYRYKPLLKIDGHSECYIFNNEIKELFNKYILTL